MTGEKPWAEVLQELLEFTKQCRIKVWRFPLPEPLLGFYSGGPEIGSNIVIADKLVGNTEEYARILAHELGHHFDAGRHDRGRKDTGGAADSGSRRT